MKRQKPKKSYPIPVRVGDKQRAKLQAEAKKQGVSQPALLRLAYFGTTDIE